MVKLDDLLKAQEKSLLGKIKTYKTVAREIKQHLDKKPEDWGRFQSDFNGELNGIFREIMLFEKQQLAKGNEAGVYKLKNLFISRLRKEFLHGDYVIRSLNKPYGYAGDFKIIDDIYQNDPQTQGFGRLFDNYYQAAAISVAVRNRKEDFKKIILSAVKKHGHSTMRIMDLASGPCRELQELLKGDLRDFPEVFFDCYDQDENAWDHAKNLLREDARRVTFVKENVVRIALKKNIETQMPQRYDLIYSTGLFDYLDKRIAKRLVENLRKLLKPDGVLAISDVREKYKNPSVHFMEWVGDWNLVYRPDDEFRQIFIDAGFSEKELSFGTDQQGVLQYIIGTKTAG
ncbi:MAG: class I SAM-dependent methyltransferase [Candidatus Omnitrophica bacterium]|nr:class I SAM-dependent methyltransferase [Candidatus Omnitrophota bacterium]